jgi:hypothetical protein
MITTVFWFRKSQQGQLSEMQCSPTCFFFRCIDRLCIYYCHPSSDRQTYEYKTLPTVWVHIQSLAEESDTRQISV